MALHDFTMQRWWMESLTAKIIAVLVELPEFCCFSFFFFFQRLSTERVPMASPCRRTLPQSRCGFPSGICVHRVRWDTREPRLNVTRLCALMAYLLVSVRLRVFKRFKSKKYSNSFLSGIEMWGWVKCYVFNIPVNTELRVGNTHKLVRLRCPKILFGSRGGRGGGGRVPQVFQRELNSIK